MRPPRYALGAHAPQVNLAALKAAPPEQVPVLPNPALTQGFVMRGYDFTFTRYFALTVKDAAKARDFIGMLVSGQAWPAITVASPWAGTKPDRCLNIGFTYPGLAALGVSEATLEASFGVNSDHYVFNQGAAARAAAVGDAGPSAPTGWRLNDRDFHVMLALWGETQATIAEDTAMLTSLLEAGFEAGFPTFDSQALDNRKVWFGYRDGIAQPHVAGVDFFAQDPDGGQALCDPSFFMLGTALPGSVYQGVGVPTPPLGLHACFGAFRILEQDVEGFDAQAVKLGADKNFRKRYGITKDAVAFEAVKALICGRWTNGVSLAVFPVNGDNLPPTPIDNQLNNFLYVLPDGAPYTDPNTNPDKGSHCPVGAHTRRGNMRGYLAADSELPAAHRIMRRAAAYQQPYAPDKPDTGERGLMGLFMCASLSNQWEFVQSQWINNWVQPGQPSFFWTDDATDPVMGVAPEGDETFFHTLGTFRDQFQLSGMQGFVTTRAGAYCLFPGIDGIGAIAAGAL